MRACKLNRDYKLNPQFSFFVFCQSCSGTIARTTMKVYSIHEDNLGCRQKFYKSQFPTNKYVSQYFIALIARILVYFFVEVSSFGNSASMHAPMYTFLCTLAASDAEGRNPNTRVIIMRRKMLLNGP
jgi:hypothetical protein